MAMTVPGEAPPGTAATGEPHPGRTVLWWSVAAGVVAYAAGLGLAELAALFVSPRATPVIAVGDTVIEYTPGWAKDFAIAVFGTRDKLFLVSLVAVVAVVLAGLSGVAERARAGAGVVLTLAVGAGLALAAATRPGGDTYAWLPGVLAGLVAAYLLPRLVRRLTDRTVEVRRRVFLIGAVVASAVAAGLIARGIGGRTRAVTSSRDDLALPGPADAAPDFPAAARFDDIEGITPFETPTAEFYRIDTALVVPAVPAQDWRLRIRGRVGREVEYRLADILDRDLVERWVTLACVSNPVGGPLTGNARWLGLPVAELLAEADPDPDADMVLSTSADGWTAGTPIEALTDDRGALLAVGMNGGPLPVEHGFPARLVVPGLFGYVSATKWVVDLEVTRFADAEAYWTVRGWAPRGPVLMNSRIDRPRQGSTTAEADGSIVVAGLAWAQDVGVSAVEVSVDEGPWQAAELAGAGTSSTWRQWRWRWRDAPSGRHVLRVRATDADGNVQTSDVAEPFPSGATGLHQVVVDVP